MTNEKKQEFTLRITNANVSQLTVILCDMFLEYCSEAEEALVTSNFDGYRTGIVRARNVLSELIRSLDRSQDLANHIYELYRFVERQLIKADISRISEPLENAKRIVDRLAESYREVAAKDTSSSLMENTQEVYAGMTYGKYDINSQTVSQSNRGFFA